MRKLLIFAAVSLSLIPLAAVCQNAKADKTSGDTKPAQTAPASIPPKQVDSAPLEGKGSDYKSGNEPIKVVVMEGPAKDAYDKFAFWANLVLVVVGIGGVVVGVCTVLFVKGQMVEMRRQRISMERSLIAMRKQISLTEETAKKQLRAYITIRNGRIYVGKDGNLRVVVEFTNSGQTPAYDLRGGGLQGLSPYPVPVLSPNAALTILSPDSVCVAGAGSRFQFESPANGWNALNNESILTSIKIGKLAYFVNGEITYSDVFKESRFLRYQIVMGGKNATPTLETEGDKSFYLMTTDSVGNEAN